MQIECVQEKDLSPQVAAEIQELQHLAFGGTPQFAHQRWWHTPLSPRELWFLARADGRLIGSVRVVFRTVLAEAGPLQIAGIANVCSHPQARGSGAARSCMEAVAEHLARGGAAFGVLMCGTSVHGFYQRLGWRDVTNKIVFIDPAGQRSPYPEGPDHFVMILGGARPAGDWPRGLIDFNGEDW